MRNDARMYVLCYKKVSYYIPNNELYTPIQCGASVFADDVCQVKDNDGDNISDWNPVFVELTGTYWIWKHHPKNIKYIGQCQYRRQLWFPEDFDFDDTFKDCDAILAKPLTFKVNAFEHYSMAHNHNDILRIESIIKNYYPDYVDAWNDVMYKHNTLFYSSGCVMRTDEFDRYCEFLFGVLKRFTDELCIKCVDDMRRYIDRNIKNGDYRNYWANKDSNYQLHVCGYLAERLMTVFVYKNFKSIRIMEYHKMEPCMKI